MFLSVTGSCAGSILVPGGALRVRLLTLGGHEASNEFKHTLPLLFQHPCIRWHCLVTTAMRTQDQQALVD